MLYICMYVYPYMYVYVSVHVCVGVLGSKFSVYLYLFVCVGCVPRHFGFIWWDPDQLQETRTWSELCRCGPDT